VHLNDVRVADGGDRLGFAKEALPLRGQCERAGENHLHRHGPVEPQVSGEQHNSHPATADDAQHVVAGHHR
jgi:hypothetical protein